MTSSTNASPPVVVLGAAGRLGRELVHAALPPDDALLFSRLRERVPETTIPYATAAEVVMRHLEKNGPFSRQRVGIALPVGRTAEKTGWKMGERG